MARADQNQAHDYMTGRSSELPIPAGIGKKFTPAGAVLPFAGNTFICHISPASAAYRALCAAQDMLRNNAPAGAYTYLPPSSLHMTVFEGICDAHRGPGDWPAGFDPTCPVDLVTQGFAPRFAGLDLPPHFTIQPFEVFAGLSVLVRGLGATDAAALQTARTMLRQSTGLQPADFSTYQFHITLAYLTRWLSEDEATAMTVLSEQSLATLLVDAPTIDIGPVEFCQFKDMHAFDPVSS